jgi:hypothetical protein
MRLSTKALLGPTGALASVLLMLTVSSASAQTAGLIQTEVDTAVEQTMWKWGPLRLTPTLRVGMGYDSNTLSSSAFEVEDFRAAIAPGIRVVTPMRNRALLEVYQEVGFVYYQRVESLRDIANRTRVGGAVGGSKVLLRVSDEFRSGKTRPTSEFDIPAELRTNVLLSELDFAIGKRHQLTISYENSRNLYEDLVPTTLRTTRLLNRREQTYGVHFYRRLTAKTKAVVEGLYQTLDFDEKESLRNGRAFMSSAGFIFNPKSNVRGQAMLGYKHMVPEFVLQPEYQGLIGSVDVQMQLGQRLDVTALYSRDTLPSLVANNWFFVEHRFGGAVDIYITRLFYVRPGATFGRNTYPNPTTFINDEGQLVEEHIEDRFDNYTLSFNYHLGAWFTATVAGNYMNRESNFRPFTKDRLFLTFGIRTSFDTP